MFGVHYTILARDLIAHLRRARVSHTLEKCSPCPSFCKLRTEQCHSATNYFQCNFKPSEPLSRRGYSCILASNNLGCREASWEPPRSAAVGCPAGSGKRGRVTRAWGDTSILASNIPAAGKPSWEPLRRSSVGCWDALLGAAGDDGDGRGRPRARGIFVFGGTESPSQIAYPAASFRPRR